MGRGVAARYEQASPEVQRLVDEVLDQDASDRAWAAQIGPALTQSATARLLCKSEQAVGKDRRLLRVRTRSGRVVYPVAQFAGRAQLPGVADVVAELGEVVKPLTIASWLTAPNDDLEGRRPVDALGDGEVAAVTALARRVARAAA